MANSEISPAKEGGDRGCQSGERGGLEGLSGGSVSMSFEILSFWSFLSFLSVVVVDGGSGKASVSFAGGEVVEVCCCCCWSWEGGD